MPFGRFPLFLRMSDLKMISDQTLHFPKCLFLFFFNLFCDQIFFKKKAYFTDVCLTYRISMYVSVCEILQAQFSTLPIVQLS